MSLHNSIKSYAQVHLSRSSLTSLLESRNHEIIPFNAHQSQYVGSRFFGYISPAAAAREVFKPSTDSASLVVPSQKNFFQFWVLGSLGGSSQVGVFSHFFGLITRPWTPIEWAHILAQVFV